MTRPTTTDSRRRRQRGMTLIEIVIVLGVIGLMVGMLVVGMGAGRAAELTRATNQVANTVRYGFDKARVNGQYYRLAINLEDGTFALQTTEDAMYLPATDRDGKIAEIDQRKIDERKERDERAEQSFNRSVQSAAYRDPAGGPDGGGDTDGAASTYQAQPKKVPRARPPLFSSFDDENSLSGLAKPFKLPEGVHIIYVRTADDLEPITKGEASIYFFPRGRTQKAHIQLEDEGGLNQYTIKIEPLTGRVTVADGLEALELPDDPREEKDDLGRRAQRRTL